jgi:hypothetical protein
MNISSKTTATIDLIIDDKVHTFSVEEAKKVCDALNAALSIFEPKKEKETVFRDYIKDYEKKRDNPIPYFRPDVLPTPYQPPQIWCSTFSREAETSSVSG